MNHDLIQSLVFTQISDGLPKAKGNQVRVYIKTENGNVRKGMFYVNGLKPTFVSYGSDVENVVAWSYWK